MRTRKGIISLMCVAIAAVSGGTAAWALTVPPQNDTPPLTAAAKQDPSHPLVASYGLRSADSKPAFVTDRGETMKAIRSSTARCLVRARGADMCSTEKEIAAGRGIAVELDCIDSPTATMEIRGFSTADVTGVTVVFSDGHREPAQFVEGAYLLETKSPAASGRYPVEIDNAGAPDRPFPFDGASLCKSER